MAKTQTEEGRTRHLNGASFGVKRKSLGRNSAPYFLVKENPDE